MDKPNIENMWEMGIRIPNGDWGVHIEVLRNRVIPSISILKEECGARWYCFHIHNNQNGVEIIGHQGAQFHIRFENSNNLSFDELRSKLPNYCEAIEKIDPPPYKISNINTSLLKGENIQEAWKIIGESCDWIIGMINSHQMVNDWEKMGPQIIQFMHFIENIYQINSRRIQ